MRYFGASDAEVTDCICAAPSTSSTIAAKTGDLSLKPVFVWSVLTFLFKGISTLAHTQT